MRVNLSAARVFDHQVDGLERTPWIPSARYEPEREGTYEVCAWMGADITRCQWDGEQWWAAARLADRLSVGYWRGISRASFSKAQTGACHKACRGY